MFLFEIIVGEIVVKSPSGYRSCAETRPATGAVGGGAGPSPSSPTNYMNFLDIKTTIVTISINILTIKTKPLIYH